jgi:AraC-like DNA-binding protein
MDRLSVLLSRFSLRAGVFYTGSICGVHPFDADPLLGHIHLIQQGPVELIDSKGVATPIVRPSLLFLPRPDAHRLIADERRGAQVLCATVRFGAGGSNPISDSLPARVLVELDQVPGVEALLRLIADEAFNDRSGRQGALDRLCELLMIHVLRHCLDHGLTEGGTLAGLSDPRLAKAMIALHEDPARDWKLSDMAGLAGMSRARFAARFRSVTGQTPADYLAGWRVTTAQGLLKSGRQMKHVAFDVGYGSSSAFTRAFVRKVGRAPTEWLKDIDSAHSMSFD